MNPRALVIMIAGLMMISIKVFTQLAGSSQNISANVDNTYLREDARNIAETGVGIGIRKIANNPAWRDGIPSMNLFDGVASVTVQDTMYKGFSCVKVQCTGTIMAGTPEQHIETAVAYLYGDTIPTALQGALVVNHDVSQKGSFTVDGRDHDDNDNVLSRTGVLGIWTVGNVQSDDDHQVLGTNQETGDDNSHHVDTAVVVRNGSYSDDGEDDGGDDGEEGGSGGGSGSGNKPFPSSPDSIMSTCGEHFSEGTLKSIAQSHANGSQYVTDPTKLTYPLQGITYVELPAGGTWQPTNMSGCGTLIVHNGTHDACMQNAAGGTFKGIVMCDEINKINCEIDGTVFDMGSKNDDPADGTGKILFNRGECRTSTGQVARGMNSNGSSFSAIAWK